MLKEILHKIQNVILNNGRVLSKININIYEKNLIIILVLGVVVVGALLYFLLNQNKEEKLLHQVRLLKRQQ